MGGPEIWIENKKLVVIAGRDMLRGIGLLAVPIRTSFVPAW